MILPADARVIRHFRTWSEQENRPCVCVTCLEALLEGRAAYLGMKDPTRWRRGDVRVLLYELAVPRLSEYCDLTAHTVPAVDAYLSFLDDTDRLHPGSSAVRHLRQELARYAGDFPAAMADRSRFRMAKTLYRAMLADGVHIDDDEAVDAWVARFNQAPEGDRAAVLEYLLVDQPALRTATFVARAGKVAALAPGQRSFDSRNLLPLEDRIPDVMPAFPPVDVPSRAEVARAARQSALLGDLLRLARWFGQGRKVTKDGDPLPADVRGVAELLGLGLPGVKVSYLYQVSNLEELFWLARQLELVDLRRTGLVAGPRLAAWQNDDALATQDDDEVLDLWREVFILVETGHELPEEKSTSKRASLKRFFAASRRRVPGVMVSLYRSAALDQDQQLAALLSPHVEELLDHLRQTVRDQEQLEDAEEEEVEEVIEAFLRIGLCLPLDRLIEHGVLGFSGPGLTEFPAVPPEMRGLPVRAVLMASSDQIWVRLTPLGRWAMQDVLRAEGAEAPSVEEG